jgi:hypothetical protein
VTFLKIANWYSSLKTMSGFLIQKFLSESTFLLLPAL